MEKKVIKRKPNKLSKRIIACALAIVMAVSGIVLFMNRSLVAEALFNPDDAIVYSEFKSKNKVDDSVVFIGTYIVHKDAMTDRLYDAAINSASESGQNEMYYKSELSDGQWFNIGNIENGIDGISNAGSPEPEANIDPLYVTFYAGEDGILRDAKTMLPVNPFDNPDPYDLSKLPELQSLWMQYTSSESATSITQEEFLKNRNSEDSGNLRSDVYYYQLLSTFFSLGPELKDAETDKCDQQLKALNELYISRKFSGDDEEAELVYGLMEMVDAKRRAIIMEKLSEVDNNLLNTLYTLATGSYYTPYGDFKDSSSEPGGADTEYNQKLQDSLQHDFSSQSSALPSFISAWFGRLGIVSGGDGWWTVLNDAESKRKREAEEANQENDDYVFDESPNAMAFNADNGLLEAIGDGMSSCGNSYTQYMAQSLSDKDDVLGHAEYEYSSAIIEASTGGTLEGPVTLLKHVNNIRTNNISDKEGELDMLLSSLLNTASSRYNSKSTAGVNSDYYTLTSINARSSSLDEQKNQLESERSMLQFLIEAMDMRDTAPNALAYVQERITWTENLKKSITEDDFKPYATSSVEAHLVWLKEEAQRIIDSDESLKSDADRLKEKKEELQKKRDGALDNNDLAGAKAYDAMIDAVDQDIDAAGGGGSGTGNMADKLTDKAMDKLADNANADLSGIADALAGMGENDKLKELKDKAAASGASDSTLNGIDNAIANANAGAGAGADAAALLAELESLFGKSLDEMDDRDLAIATAVMSQLARSGITAAGDMVSQLMNRLLSTNNKYVYTQYLENKTVEYVDLKVLSECTSYRYFYDESKSTGTVTRGAKVYIFKRGSNQMHNGTQESEPEEMTDQAVYQGNLYLGEADTGRYFKCIAEYIYSTRYSVLLTGPMQAVVTEFVQAMQDFAAPEAA